MTQAALTVAGLGVGGLDDTVAVAEGGNGISPGTGTVATTRLALLGCFRVTDGATDLHLSRGAQRLLAFLALRPEGVARDFASGVLWPDIPEKRAHANLRSALRRLGPAARAVRVNALDISLAPGVFSDYVTAKAIANHLLAGRLISSGYADVIATLTPELLPGWYDDWVLLETENWRQLRLHALEALARSLTNAHRFGEAAHAAAVAVAIDPLRETARSALIRVHIAEGNQSEAIRAFENYRELLRAVLAVEPTNQLRQLVLESLAG